LLIISHTYSDRKAEGIYQLPTQQPNDDDDGGGGGGGGFS